MSKARRPSENRPQRQPSRYVRLEPDLVAGAPVAPPWSPNDLKPLPEPFTFRAVACFVLDRFATCVAVA